MKVNSALVYSRIRIGFDKQDYDTANGKDEFRFTNEYTTGVTMTDNSLEMISPYRADAYGIEFLADKIGEDTTDNESDTDLFMVGVKSDSSGLKYILNRDYLMGGVLSPDTMFNAMFSPSSMVLANEAYIGSSVEMLTFASSDGNSDVGIDGMGESRDIILSKGCLLWRRWNLRLRMWNFRKILQELLKWNTKAKLYRDIISRLITIYKITKFKGNFDREKFKFVIKIQILIVIFAMKACEVTSY